MGSGDGCGCVFSCSFFFFTQDIASSVPIDITFMNPSAMHWGNGNGTGNGHADGDAAAGEIARKEEAEREGLEARPTG